jgi:tetratricopeptide (TPR) repeat protein
MDENIDKMIRDYAEGHLAGNALQEFELRLKNEPALQAELDLYLVLKATDNQRLKKQFLQAADQLTPLAPSGGRVRRLPLWLAAAASLALVLTAVWWWQQPAKSDAVQLAQTYISTSYPPPVTSMGEADSRPPDLQRAFLAYRNGDFTTAAQQLTELSVAADATDETLFYAGEALLQTGQLERAIAHFDRVRPGYWREIADWRCALALLKNGQTARAKPLLEKLRNSARRAQVETLLKAME